MFDGVTEVVRIRDGHDLQVRQTSLHVDIVDTDIQTMVVVGHLEAQAAHLVITVEGGGQLLPREGVVQLGSISLVESIHRHIVGT